MTVTIYGTGPAFLDNSGNLGIGTIAPVQKLSLASGNSNIALQMSFNTATGATVVGLQSDNSFIINQQIGQPLIFNTSNAERMRIDSSGNIGVGTTSIIATFDVNGEIRTASSANWNYAALNVVRKASNTSTPRMISMALGGDDSASTTIGAYNAIWGIYNASPSASSTSSALQGEMAYAAYYGHRWYNNGTERMRIDSSGQLWKGYSSQIFTASTYQFGVSFPGSSSQGIVIKNTENNQAGAAIRFVDYLGNFTGGGIYFQTSGSVSYSASSDYRLKKDIQPITNGLSTITSLNPVSFKWKADDTKGEGFIAHELAKYIPNAVIGDKDAIYEDGSVKSQVVDQSKIIAHLVAAVKELKAEFDLYKATHP